MSNVSIITPLRFHHHTSAYPLLTLVHSLYAFKCINFSVFFSRCAPDKCTIIVYTICVSRTNTLGQPYSLKFPTQMVNKSASPITDTVRSGKHWNVFTSSVVLYTDSSISSWNHTHCANFQEEDRQSPHPYEPHPQPSQPST